MFQRFGPGPVFLFECITSSRRWQFYAGRVIFIGALFVALLVVWQGQLGGRGLATIGRDAEAGEKFFYGVTGTELALLLLVAPAATAGAICADKSSGTLAHVLVTDLRSIEIVLGKLAARLLPVFGLILGTAPVMFLATLLGGIDPEALAGSLTVMLGTAVLACTIALALSVWAGKTHEALLGTYAVLAIWLLAKPLWHGLGGFIMSRWGYATTVQWLEDSNPFYLVFAAYRRPGVMLWSDYRLYCIICLGLSILLTAVAVWRMRSVFLRQANRPAPVRPSRSTLSAWRCLSGFLPGPALDTNPVLWREWHRNRPSRFVQLVWLSYTILATAASAAAMVHTTSTTGWIAGNLAAWVNALQVSVGLLLLSVLSATSIAEERARGNLDVLLATPLTTRAIVWGKFWGTYRFVPVLALLPMLVIGAGVNRNGHAGHLVLAVALILAYGAALTSLGLFMGTWIKRLSRAIISTVSAYVFVTVGWLFLIGGLAQHGRTAEGLMSASPFLSLGAITFEVCADQLRPELLGWRIFWCGSFAFVSVVLIFVTLATFDMRMSRMPDWSFRSASGRARLPDAARKPILLVPGDSPQPLANI